MKGPMLAWTVLAFSILSPMPETYPAMDTDARPCPVTIPNGATPPSSRTWFGMGPDTAYGTGVLYTGLPRTGVLLATPRFTNPDGSVHMKWPWYRTVPGIVTIQGHRLDGPAPSMPEVRLRGQEDGYGETGFHPSLLVFPTEGCWEVTARVATYSLTFVVRVLKIPYEPMWADWLPGGVVWKGTDVSEAPDAIREVYGYRDGSGGVLVVETSSQGHEDVTWYTSGAGRPMMFGVRRGFCREVGHGGNRGWRSDPDATALVWASEGLFYRVRQEGLGLHCEDLMRVAGLIP